VGGTGRGEQLDGQLAKQRAANAPTGPKPRYASHGAPVPPPPRAEVPHHGFLAGSTSTATSKNVKAKGRASAAAAASKASVPRGGESTGGGEGVFKEVMLVGLVAKLRKKLALSAMRHHAEVANVRNRLLAQLRRYHLMSGPYLDLELPK
jgi:hypothetical protein